MGMSWAGALITSRVARVVGSSMTPRLRHGTYVLVDTWAYRRMGPRRSDVVLARHPAETGRYFLKRVVGLPGERVRVRDGVTCVNGEEIEEPYALGWGLASASDDAEWSVGKDEFVLLGDNRVDSIDSRRLGPFHRNLILGCVWLAVWPRRAWGRVR